MYQIINCNMEQTTKRGNAMTQREIVLDHLQRNGNITSWWAFYYYKITRLSEYIRQLRVEGHHIISNWEQNEDKRWVRYELMKEGGAK